MSGFYTKTPKGNIVHIKGNRKMPQKSLDIINKTFDLAVKQAQAQIEREAAYQYALYALDLLDRPNPGSGDQLTRRLWRADGELILTLDEFVRAALDNELVACPPRLEWLGEM